MGLDVFDHPIEGGTTIVVLAILEAIDADLDDIRLAFEGEVPLVVIPIEKKSRLAWDTISFKACSPSLQRKGLPPSKIRRRTPAL